MKQIFIVIFFTLSVYSNLYAQSDWDEKDNCVKIYLVKWNLRTKFPYTVKIFKEYYDYAFEFKNNELKHMFVDYIDCVEKLSSQTELIIPDSVKYTALSKSVTSYVKLDFDKKKTAELYFDANGNYYFQDKWHIRNDGIYYILFRYFSSDLIYTKSIESAKQNYTDALWHKN